MSHLLTLGILALTLGGCVIGGEPPLLSDLPPGAAPIVGTPAPEVQAPPPAPSEPVFDFSLGAAPYIPPSAQPPKPLFIKNSPPDSRQVAALSPEQVIREANTFARVAPTARNYFGGGGTARYLYSPGKIYDVYLSPASGTRIMLPPSEILANELILPADSFDVSTVTVGTEVNKSSILFIRPCAPSESSCKPVVSVDVALVSESGRSYDLHLIVGKVGMVAVTWAIAPIPNIQVEEPPPQGALR
jgi:hypothetical protein